MLYEHEVTQLQEMADTLADIVQRTQAHKRALANLRDAGTTEAGDWDALHEAQILVQRASQSLKDVLDMYGDTALPSDRYVEVEDARHMVVRYGDQRFELWRYQDPDLFDTLYFNCLHDHSNQYGTDVIRRYGETGYVEVFSEYFEYDCDKRLGDADSSARPALLSLDSAWWRDVVVLEDEG